MSPQETTPSPRSQWGAFRHRAFTLYWAARLLASFSVNIVSVAIGWQVYDLTKNPLDLGIIGLVQFLPALALVLVTGAAADRFSRRMILIVSILGEALAVGGLLLFVASGSHRIEIVFVILFGFGIVRAFLGPAAGALAPNLVPAEDLATAIAWNSSAWQFATITGPVVGGLLYGVTPVAPFLAAMILLLVAVALLIAMPRVSQMRLVDKASWESVVAGFRYVWKEKIVLGAISLDLFAVLLGGATALLPVYARDVLAAGPLGLGMLRAAPAIGSISVAAWLAFHPVRDHAGILLFVFVTLFGIFTIVFGLSTVTWVSVAALALMGACDMVSVYIRETLIQLWTPDALRGRVNAVNTVFIGASNELGEFRAGVSAALLGAVGAVVFGGVGTVIVAGVWAKLFPALRGARRLDGRP